MFTLPSTEVLRKKAVRIVPQVNFDDDYDPILLQLVRETRNQEVEPHSVHIEAAKSVASVSKPRASLQKGSSGSGYLECW